MRPWVGKVLLRPAFRSGCVELTPIKHEVAVAPRVDHSSAWIPQGRPTRWYTHNEEEQPTKLEQSPQACSRKLLGTSVAASKGFLGNPKDTRM